MSSAFWHAMKSTSHRPTVVPCGSFGNNEDITPTRVAVCGALCLANHRQRIHLVLLLGIGIAVKIIDTGQRIKQYHREGY